MLSEQLHLFFEFFKIGLFTFGGGYGSLPFLYEIADLYNWFSIEELTQMIAIAGITPGPVGLNMATFAGYKAFGLFGAFISSFALLLPMLIVTSMVFKFYLKFSENKCVQSILYVLRPTSCALILAIALRLIYNLVLNNDLSFKNIDICGLILILFLFVLTFKLKRDPIIYITIAAFVGVIIKFC